MYVAVLFGSDVFSFWPVGLSVTLLTMMVIYLGSAIELLPPPSPMLFQLPGPYSKLAHSDFTSDEIDSLFPFFLHLRPRKPSLLNTAIDFFELYAPVDGQLIDVCYFS